MYSACARAALDDPTSDASRRACRRKDLFLSLISLGLASPSPEARDQAIRSHAQSHGRARHRRARFTSAKYIDYMANVSAVCEAVLHDDDARLINIFKSWPRRRPVPRRALTRPEETAHRLRAVRRRIQQGEASRAAARAASAPAAPDCEATRAKLRALHPPPPPEAEAGARALLAAFEAAGGFAAGDPTSTSALPRRSPPTPTLTADDLATAAAQGVATFRAEHRANLDKAVKKAIFGLHRTSAPGAAAVPVPFLRNLVDGDASFLPAYTEFIASVLEGKGAVADDRLHWAGAELSALDKGKGAIRPIACGTLDRRIAGKAFAYLLQPTHERRFLPRQLGVGIREGVPRAVHRLRRVARKSGDGDVELLADFINAFNNISRAAVIAAVRAEVPELLPFVLYLYSQRTALRYGGKRLCWSECGLHQGDPLAPFLFSLVVNYIIKLIDKKCPGLLEHLWYLDDATFCGSPQEVYNAFVIVRGIIARALGLSLNETKTVLVCKSAAAARTLVTTESGERLPLAEALGNVKVITDGNYVALGSPIGHPDFEADFIKRNAVHANARLTEEIVKLDDPHSIYYVLRACAGFCKVNHLLRTVPPSPEVSRALAGVTAANSKTFAAIGVDTGVPSVAAQARLAPGLGGFGVRDPVEHHAVAYLSSLRYADVASPVFSADNAELASLVETVNASISPSALEAARLISGTRNRETMIIGTPDCSDLTKAWRPITTSDNVDVIYQRRLSKWLDHCHLVKLRRQFAPPGGPRDTVALSRLRQLQAPFAGAWLAAVPDPRGAGYLNGFEWLCAARVRTGQPVFPGELSGHPCAHCQLAKSRSARAQRASPSPISTPPPAPVPPAGDDATHSLSGDGPTTLPFVPRQGGRASRRKAGPTGEGLDEYPGRNIVDARGFHALRRCGAGYSRIHRHNAIARTIAQGATRGQLRPSLERHITGTAKRDADIWLPTAGGTPERSCAAALDVVVVDGRSRPILGLGSTTRLADAAAANKRTKLARATGSNAVNARRFAKLEEAGAVTYHPIAMTHFGAVAIDSLSMLRLIGEQIGLRTAGASENAKDRAVHAFLCSIGACLQRENAKIILDKSGSAFFENADVAFSPCHDAQSFRMATAVA